MSKLKGRELVVFHGATLQSATAFGMSTNCTINLSNDIIEVTNPLSGNSKAFVPGRYTWTVTTDCLVSVDGSDISTLLTQRANKMRLYMSSAQKSDGSLVPSTGFALSGDAYITSVNVTASEDGSATYSVSFQGTGDLTFTSI